MAGRAHEGGGLPTAAALLVGFNGLLRPRVAALAASQRAFGYDEGNLHLDLGLAKSGTGAGIAEHVVVDELEGALPLARAPSGRRAGFLRPRGAPAFRAAFGELLAQIGANPPRYKPCSLRRGGAAHR